MKTIVCLLFAFVTTFFAISAETKEWQQNTPLVIAMSNDTYPFQFVDENNQPSGLLVDIWLEWAKQTNTQVVFKPSDWVQSLANLENGIADVHIGMAKNSTRELNYDFMPELFSFHSFLYVNYQLPQLDNLSDVLPYKVGVVKGAAQINILKAQEPKLAFSYFDNRTDLMQAVINEEVLVFVGLEGFLRESQINHKVSIQYPKENRKSIAQFAFSPAVAKGNQNLAQQVTQGFAAITTDIMQGHIHQWLGEQRYQNEIVISMQSGVGPYADLGADDLPHGLLVDIWKLWSEKTGLPVRFLPANMQQSLDNVQRGVADVHLGYPESATMKSGLNRTHPIYQVKSRLFSYKARLHSLTELKGSVVGVAPTSPYLNELADALPDSQLRYYPSVDAMIDAAIKGDISAFVAAGAWTQHYLLLNQSWDLFFQFPDLEFNTDLYVLNRNRDVGFAERVASGFKKLSLAELTKIEQKWMLNPNDRIYGLKTGNLILSSEQKSVIEALGPIKVGYLRDWRPMEFVEEGKYAGINSDVIKIIANALGLTIQTIVFDDWQSLLDGLVSGKVDMVGSVAKTPEREYQLGFSDAYWPAPWGLVTPHSYLNVFDLEELSGQRVAVVEGYHIVGQLLKEFPQLKLVLVSDSQAGLKAVDQGNADVFIDKVVNLSSGLRGGKYSSLKMSILVDFAEQRSHIGVHSSKKALLPFINMVLAGIDNVTQRQIHQKWVSQTIEIGRNEYEKQLKFGLMIFAILVLGVITALLANRHLRCEIARRIEAESKMAHFAKHDCLTQLPNRSLIDDRLEQAILSHTRDTGQFAVVFVDLDGFKSINDEYGHHAGDLLLTHVSEQLRKSVRQSDTVGRIGGDEFVIILNNIRQYQSVVDVAENILNNLTQPFIIQGHTVTTSASIGIAFFPQDGDTVDTLLRSADKQMYRAKNAGGGTYRCVPLC
ncbi:deoxyguanosine kinase [Shewanella sairae]|uniref:Deoxyguanosine kinase n=1 Tax=Shewanella sairae TaxID=190310 RepID=A0ABQ4PRB2_9GAMM|nr:transporter substrate-binding domain-containing protein [Shewanella sairae]MCL1130166.1 transporter substrate-binding domain-containing protein [Shewanella sairae]GIU51628.1 deoxyguanosine kinase [Shewanella sairae]